MEMQRGSAKKTEGDLPEGGKEMQGGRSGKSGSTWAETENPSLLPSVFFPVRGDHPSPWGSYFSKEEMLKVRLECGEMQEEDYPFVVEDDEMMMLSEHLIQQRVLRRKLEKDDESKLGDLIPLHFFEEEEPGQLEEEQESELGDVIKEIMYLERERRDLLGSLTPSFSQWKQTQQIQPIMYLEKGERRTHIQSTQEAATTWRKENTSSVSYKTNSQHEQLAGLLDCIVEDVTDLGHRMLSMAHVTMESDAPMNIPSSYKAKELVNRTSRLKHISEELYKYTRKEEDEADWEEVQSELQFELQLQSELEVMLQRQLHIEEVQSASELEVMLRSHLHSKEVMRSKYRARLLKKEISKMKVELRRVIQTKRKRREWKERERKEQMWMGGSKQVDEFLFLCKSYLQIYGSHNYMNELGLILTEEKEKAMEEEEEEEAKKKERERKEKDASTPEFLKMVMGYYQEMFDHHRASWERVWGSNIGRYGSFGDTTTLSSMHFTHYTPATFPSPAAALSGSTLQIYSIKIRKLNGNLNWPLKVYGIVAARDTVDRNRNILFSRSRRNYQVLTADDPFLCLTGPSRAILAVNPVDFEVKLKINRALICLHKSYHACGSTPLSFHSFPPKNRDNHDYVAELSVGRLDTPLQATIVGVRVVEGVWPFQHGCRVVCSSSAASEVSGSPTPEVVLLDYRGEMMRVGSDGYLRLSRNVVSVEFYGRLTVDIHAYSESGYQAQGNHVHFPAQHCQTSKGELLIGNSKLEIVVAWSFLVKDKLDLLVDCLAQS